MLSESAYSGRDHIVRGNRSVHERKTGMGARAPKLGAKLEHGGVLLLWAELQELGVDRRLCPRWVARAHWTWERDPESPQPNTASFGFVGGLHAGNRIYRGPGPPCRPTRVSISSIDTRLRSRGEGV